MKTLIANKSFLKLLAVVLSVLLVVALIPQIQIAYSDPNAHLEDTEQTEMADTGEDGSPDEGTGEEEPGTFESEEAVHPEEELTTPEFAVMMMASTDDPNEGIDVQAEEQTKMETLSTTSDSAEIPSDKFFEGTLLYNDGKAHELVVNGTLKGHVIVTNGTLTIKGNGTIDADNKKVKYTGNTIEVTEKPLNTKATVLKKDDKIGSVILVASSNARVDLEGSVVITGGTGTPQPAFAEPTADQSENGTMGGGIYVVGQGKLYIKGGTITANTASAGGGVAIWHSYFTMNGGTIDNNEASLHEGGGLYFNNGPNNAPTFTTWGYVEDPTPPVNGKKVNSAYGLLAAGHITNNTTRTTTDWGGGGLFVQAGSKLWICSSSITNNTAKGLGGGVSGCPHAMMMIGEITKGAAIYGNSSQTNVDGTSSASIGWPQNEWLHYLTTSSTQTSDKKIVAGDFLFRGMDTTRGDVNKRTNGAKTKDKNGNVTSYYYATVSNGAYGNTGFDSGMAKDYYCTKASTVAATDLGDSKGIAWTGYQASGPLFEFGKDTTISSATAGTVTIPIDTDFSAPDASLGLTSKASSDSHASARKVFIENNHSNTHGGGVGCNGTISFGEYNEERHYPGSYSLEISKELINSLPNSKPLELLDNEFTFTLTDSENKTYTAQNAKDGKVVFNNLPGLTMETGTATAKYRLTENTPTTANCTPGIPSGIDIVVSLSVTKTQADVGYLKVYNYVTEVTDVAIDGDKPADANVAVVDGVLTVTNKINLSHGITLGAKKEVVELPSDYEYKFDLYDVTTGMGTASEPGANAAASALKETGTLLDSKNITGSGSVNFDGNKLKYTAPGTHWYLISEDSTSPYEQVDYDKSAYLVKVDVALSENGRSLLHEKTWYKDANDGRGFEKTSKPADNQPVFTNALIDYEGFNLSLQKKVLTLLAGPDEGEEVNLDGAFVFTLTDPDEDGLSVTATASVTGDDSKTGYATFNLFTDSFDADDNVLGEAAKKYAKETYKAWKEGKSYTHRFVLTEAKQENGDANMHYISETKVDITFEIDSQNRNNDRGVYLVTPKIKSIQIGDGDVNVTVLNGNVVNVANRYIQNGYLEFEADKSYLGTDNKAFTFTMTEVAAPASLSQEKINSGQPLVANAPVVALTDAEEGSISNQVTWKGKTQTYDAEGRTKIVFDRVDYAVISADKTDVGPHWYKVTEDGAYNTDGSVKPGMDGTVYLIKVMVSVNDDNHKLLKADIDAVYYADNEAAYEANELNVVDYPNEGVDFENIDTNNAMAFAFASYSVYAASNEPVDQVCYVDPKIIKVLDGRAIQPGEFAFELYQMPKDAFYDADGNPIRENTQIGDPTFDEDGYLIDGGVLISSTTNDEFGMVDFDKAADVTNNPDDPCCLKFTQPGEYSYLVVEDTSNGGFKDSSVEYSKEAITFNVEIEKQGDKLVCVNEWYGHIVNGANVPFEDQYTDGSEPAGSTEAYPSFDRTWHPTMTNTVRAIDLQVRKMSKSEGNEGLEGAVYGLYMVNKASNGDPTHEQELNDILMTVQEYDEEGNPVFKPALGTSDAGGYIVFKNVSLNTNSKYYFKEVSAPAGHTVSPYRSQYFMLKEVKTATGTSYELVYSDSDADENAGLVDGLENGSMPEASLMTLDLEDEVTGSAFADEPVKSPDGNLLLTYAADGGVYDEVTDVSFNKLDTRTHEWVSGAKLAILEKDTGKEIVSWTSGAESKQVAKTLNVGTTYILREVEAPANYSKAGDVEFIIDDYGKVTILSGASNGNADLSDTTITLYDTMLDAEEVDTQERETIIQRLAQTGDTTLLGGLALVAIASLALVATSVVRRRKMSDE